MNNTLLMIVIARNETIQRKHRKDDLHEVVKLIFPADDADDADFIAD